MLRCHSIFAHFFTLSPNSHKLARTSCTSSNPVASGEHGGSEKIPQPREFSNDLFR